MSSLAEQLGEFFGVEWSRPLYLLAALLAALTLLAGFVRSRPRMRPLGTTELWRELLEERSRVRSSDRVQRRFPPHLLALAGSLFCLSIALAGPIPKQPPLPRRFTVYVDAHPGMGLDIGDGTGTRAAKARASFDRWRTTIGAEVSFEFREGLPAGGGARGDIILTDEAAPWLDAPVGLFASGGEIAPGDIGLGVGASGTPLVYRLEAQGEVVAVESAERVAVSFAGELPRAVREVFLSWAMERGFEAYPGSPAEALLTLAGPVQKGERTLEGGLDGWSARGPARRLPAGWQSSQPWLRSGSEVLVACVPGEIQVAWSSFEERSGSDADFALSWARLFDQVLRTPPGVVAARDREAAGPARERPPALEDAVLGTVPKESRVPLDLVFGIAAFALALAAAFLRHAQSPT